MFFISPSPVSAVRVRRLFGRHVHSDVELECRDLFIALGADAIYD
jgi:hypothetical protein